MCSCSGNCNCNSGTIPRGPQGLQGPAGPTGSTGAEGTPGSIWYQDSGTPSNLLGINNDFYLDTDNGNVYQKVLGIWTGPVVNLTGQTGAQGAQGIAGVVRLYSNTNNYQSSTAGVSFLPISPNILANVLTTNGQALKFTMYYTNRLNTGVINEIGVKFANQYVSSQGFNTAGRYTLPWNSVLDMTTFWTVELVRRSSDTLVCYNTIGAFGEAGAGSGATFYNFTDITTISGLDFTIPNSFQIEIQQQASNQIQVNGAFIDLINYA
jgi:hypothetical protein